MAASGQLPGVKAIRTLPMVIAYLLGLLIASQLQTCTTQGFEPDTSFHYHVHQSSSSDSQKLQHPTSMPLDAGSVDSHTSRLGHAPASIEQDASEAHEPPAIQLNILGQSPAGTEDLGDSLPLYLTQSNRQRMAELIAGSERVVILSTLSLSYRGSEHSSWIT